MSSCAGPRWRAGGQPSDRVERGSRKPAAGGDRIPRLPASGCLVSSARGGWSAA
ncbi:MAG: hypothetical protein AVDCRST_MAG11-1317 [uncultured Gemmatimonadaceae bacterium]|uniref:Uncharacterized protein n=1 Tax=uncultured Gemmatimonadaceae bacterium TaxID=246130 RepID=A0A6J4KM63_9BACT|nr:MAG: hypothetical protein AVDCRST_MAG11-1317 [uncultured Gemmatimonadaceae bacterium]